MHTKSCYFLTENYFFRNFARSREHYKGKNCSVFLFTLLNSFRILFMVENSLYILMKIRGGHSSKFYTGRLRPEVQTFTLLYAIFDRKGTPFIYIP